MNTYEIKFATLIKASSACEARKIFAEIIGVDWKIEDKPKEDGDRSYKAHRKKDERFIWFDVRGIPDVGDK